MLKPFFCYFGGKWRAAPRYPKPRFDHIVEPFAGAAGYATRYAELQVTLHEIDPVIYGIWDYLIHTSEEDILALPVGVQHLDAVEAPAAAKHLIGFWLNKGGSQPKKSPSVWAKAKPESNWGPEIRARIAYQVQFIRHWKVFNTSYLKADDVAATWFIDPPYQGPCGQHYRYRKINYKVLADWCRQRRGQTLVCEQTGATWLPFQYLSTIKSTPGAKGKSFSSESLWVNSSTVDPEHEAFEMCIG